ncbi:MULTISPECIES: hypothetical protein [Streptomyces]|uniref:hypothetical protein n=1 Tax=Streptomyces TaxID=1883 RepID=UPI0015C4BD97|nr:MULTISPECIES: hypothetical protein [Streptomyces]MBK0373842.1 hypothetical protein [Streptomyces sp. RB110-1]MBK0389790.1 hypothetical protein [Streptomyces sp. RB110-2]MCF3168333.1 hypothetical protein [Streptomyces violaceoruber]MDW4898422.1 hypothetical protein [Streptomyces californicus]QLG31444.1 hypothetical protein HXS80_06890 [Streptomyces sp. CB04723]
MTHALAPAAPPASAADPARFLRLVLRVDSVSTAVMGLVLVAAAAPLGSLTGMPVAFAVGFGIFQLGGAASLALIAGYPVIPLALARTVVAVNAVCAVGCLVTAFADVVPLNGTGVVFLLIGAVIVAVYTALQYTGLRRMTAGTA